VEPRLRMVEVGAGTGRNSDYMRDLVLRHHTKRDPSIRPEEVHYTATDVAGKGGAGGHLESVPPGSGIHANEESVDANHLDSHFAADSLDAVVGANPFGDWKTPGASYGLRKIDKRRAKNHEMTFDHRFLQSAHKVLREGGKVRVFARTQILKRSTSKPGPYANASESDLKRAAGLGFDVHVRRAYQDGTRTFERPDTMHKDKDPNAKLGPFNTELVFRKRRGPGGVKLHTAEHEIGPVGALAVDSDEDLAPSETSEMPSSHAATPAAAAHPAAVSSPAAYRAAAHPAAASSPAAYPAAPYPAAAYRVAASSPAAYPAAASSSADRAAAEHVQAMDMENSLEEENERFRRRDAQHQDERDNDPEG
jgi:hypothetical protein